MMKPATAPPTVATVVSPTRSAARARNELLSSRIDQLLWDEPEVAILPTENQISATSFASSELALRSVAVGRFEVIV